MTDVSAEDVAEFKRQGDFDAFLAQITGRSTPAAEPEPEIEEPAFHIRRPGAWPCGTAATGPAPPPCNECQTRTAHPHPTDPKEPTA